MSLLPQPEHDLPDSYHVLAMSGLLFFIDGEVRKEIEHFLRRVERPYDFIIVDSIAGEEVTVIPKAVGGIWSTTPRTRERDAEVRRRIRAENPMDDE